MTKPNVAKRSISPLLLMCRDFLLGRKHNTPQRFSIDVATRSPPLPNLPDGPSHQLSSNYYFQRDARREVMPPTIVASKQLQIAMQDGSGLKKPPTPGTVYSWD